MKTIAVTGGKGGTGKSTFAVLLAFQQILQGKKVLLVDCDVECPNDYIILGIRQLKSPSKKTFTFCPKILKDKCTKCGLCVQNCRSNAIFLPKDKFPVIEEELCSSCGVCWTLCPSQAILKSKVLNGEIFKNKIEKNLTLITGVSKPGIRETSPVVKQTREYAKKKIKKFDVCIIDTAAGTHCTVISALEEAHMAYAVTEPTPVGAHDLRLILEVLNVLKVPSSIVLNQFDLGDKSKIEKIAVEYKTAISVRIPYNKRLAKIYSEGKLSENKDLFELLQYI